MTKGIEQVETDSWNNEQVHGGNVRRMVTQEGRPSLAGRRPPFDHVVCTENLIRVDDVMESLKLAE
jgi:hypothetical protein